MSTLSRQDKADAIRQLLTVEGPAVAENTRGFNAGRYASVAKLSNYETLKDKARAIKEQAIENLPALIDQLRASVEANGGTVYIARDAADANRHIRKLIGDGKRVVKSKSMTSEEIDINEHLERDGIEVVETDLGEWVLQVAHESPSHIVAPAIHRSKERIAELFNKQFEPEKPLETAEELTMFARGKLGELIKGADVGMTGANFLVAETGSLALVTSEGNARKTALVPPKHIAVAGVEKIIPTIEDLQPFIELIGRSGTGQDITSYISLFTPPLPTPVPHLDRSNGTAPETDRSFHLVLLDNGRMVMREDAQLKETLYCIRCSACANTCANFQSVGGHAFGGETYSGGIATGWEAGVHGLDSASTFNDLCTGCSRCVPACPVQIDIPWINTVVRDRLNEDTDHSFDWLVEGLVPDDESGSADLQKHVFGNFELLAKASSATAPLSNQINRTKPVRMLMEKMLGIDRRRELPEFKRHTLTHWFAKRSSPAATSQEEVILYADLYTNYVHTERGQAAVRALEALGVNVQLSKAMASGRAPLSQGMIATAEKQAQRVFEKLKTHIEAGRKIVVIEPSDLAMFQRDYGKLLPKEAYETLQKNSFEILEYLQQQVAQGADLTQLRAGNNQRLAYHSHCQQRTLGLEKPTVELLTQLGYDVATSSVECCGMAGSFGYKREYYELSMQVGEHLREQFSTEAMKDRTVVASGTSCHEQLDALLEDMPTHPIQLIAPEE